MQKLDLSPSTFQVSYRLFFSRCVSISAASQFSATLVLLLVATTLVVPRNLFAQKQVQGYSGFATQSQTPRTGTTQSKDETTKIKSRKPRSSIQINRDISTFLRNEAIAETEFERAAAIRDLCSIAIEVRFDPRFGRQLHMQPLMKRIRLRLTKILKKADVGDQLGQGGDLGRLSRSMSQEVNIDEALAENLQLAGFSSGGPLTFFSQTHGANGGGIIRQNADDLIQLIQTTIAPSFWDVNGGPGTIVFFPQLNALIVRATEDIHYKIGGSIAQLEFFNQ